MQQLESKFVDKIVEEIEPMAMQLKLNASVLFICQLKSYILQKVNVNKIMNFNTC